MASIDMGAWQTEAERSSGEVGHKKMSKIGLNKFRKVSSLLAEVDQESHDMIISMKERSLKEKERELNALKGEFKQLEIAEENMRQQIAEKQKSVLQMEQDNYFQSNTYKNKKDLLKQLKKTLHSLKKEIDMLKGDPLTERDQEKLLICKKKFVLYETCTGVIFDYSSKDPIKGFVQNPVTKYLSTFSIEKNSDVETAVWLESTKGGALQCSQHSTPENPCE